jgi:hypothetical protein
MSEAGHDLMTLDKARDHALEHAASIIDKMHAEEMERIGLMVALGVNTEIAEAVAARLTEAAVAIRKRIAKDTSHGG